MSEVGSIPEDLIKDVLVRVPATSIGRFRCVSKDWRSLLSNPQFIKDHLNFHILHDHEKLVVTDSSDNFSVVSILRDGGGKDGFSRKLVPPLPCLSNLEQNKWVKAESSCHGLVLLTSQDSSFLMNPITSEVVKLSSYGSPVKNVNHYSAHTLGYDDANDDYKIVIVTYTSAIYYLYYCPETKVYIYSVKSKTWKSLGNSPYDHYFPHNAGNGTFFNGNMHWLARDIQTEPSKSSIIAAAFDLSSEKFVRSVHLPSSVDSGSVHCRLATLGGYLALSLGPYSEFEVWLMKDYGVQESWTKITLNCYACGIFNSFEPCLLRGDEFIFVKDRRKLVLHCLSSGAWRDMEVVGHPGIFASAVLTFKESLLSPNCLDQPKAESS